jgi:hypothetical protein
MQSNKYLLKNNKYLLLINSSLFTTRNIHVFIVRNREGIYARAKELPGNVCAVSAAYLNSAICINNIPASIIVL